MTTIPQSSGYVSPYGSQGILKNNADSKINVTTDKKDTYKSEHQGKKSDGGGLFTTLAGIAAIVLAVKNRASIAKAFTKLKDAVKNKEIKSAAKDLYNSGKEKLGNLKKSESVQKAKEKLSDAGKHISDLKDSAINGIKNKIKHTK